MSSISGVSAGSAQLNTTLQALQAVGVTGLPSGGGGDSVSPQDVASISQAALQLQTVTALLSAAVPQIAPQNGSHVNVLG